MIFAFSYEPDQALIPLARRCEELGLEVSLVPRFFDSINDRSHVERIGGLPLIGFRPVDPKGWQFTVKYALDRPIALLGLLVLAPLVLAVALAVKLSSQGPVLFRQRRVGRDGQVFDMLKFRSMSLAPAPTVAPRPGLGARRRRGPGPAHVRRALPAPHVARRAAAAPQRAAGRDVAGRPAAGAPRVRVAVRARPRALHRPPSRQVGHHRLGAGAAACAARPRSPTASSGTTTTSRTGRRRST